MDANIEKVNQECRWSVGIAPYIYDEMTDDETLTFEVHLNECQACIDQIADVSFARYEVYEWRKLQFEPLTTPQIEIHYAKTPDPRAVETAFDRIRKIFTFAPAWAAVAAALVLGFGLFYLGTGVGDQEISRVEPPTAEKAPAAIPSAAIAANEERLPDARTAPADAVTPSAPAAIPTVVRTAPKPAERPASVRQRVTPPARVEAGPAAEPRLAGAPIPEDNSPRLSDLFDDVETME